MSAKRKKRETAEEVLARLHADPEWARKNAAREAAHAASVAKLQTEIAPEQAPLLADLALVGLHVSSVWDLVNTKMKYPTAIPVLVEYLRTILHPVLREGIARALTVPEARGSASRAILEELKVKKDEHGVRFALANALTVIGDTSVAEQLAIMIVDPNYQDIRSILELAWQRSATRRQSKE